MHPGHTTTRRRQRPTALAWMVVALVFLQSVVSSALMTWGPAHAHRPMPETTAFAEGAFALWAPAAQRATAPATHAHTALGHVHARAASERHHHAPGDVSVAYDDPADLGGSGHGSQPSEAASLFIGLAPHAAPWCAPELQKQAPTHAAWACKSADVRRLERPPLRVAAL